MNATTPINLADLRNRVMDDDVIIQHMLTSFSGVLESQLTAIRTALATGESPAVARAAHSLKGAAANLSAEPLRDACGALEIAAKENNPSAFPQLAAAIKSAAIDLRLALPVCTR